MSRTEAPRRASRDLEQAGVGGVVGGVVGGRVALARTEPIWMGDQIPRIRHRRRDCSRTSAAGQTTVVAVHPLSGSPWYAERCPCGAFRELYDGKPAGRWEFRNKAFKNPTWWTQHSPVAHQVPCTAAGGEAEVNHTNSHHRGRHLAEGPHS